LRAELDKHLTILQRQGIIETWHDRKITPGTEWQGAIDEHLCSAHMILLLISSDFMASEYCYDVELKTAMQRHELGKAKVVPIILRRVMWDGAPFAKLQVLPTGGVAVKDWVDLDVALDDVARGIRAAAESMARV
jgi:hypothetical protein